jgi:hypothetical protein
MCVWAREREREEAQSGSWSGFDDDADDYDETAEELVASFATRDYTKPFSWGPSPHTQLGLIDLWRHFINFLLTWRCVRADGGCVCLRNSLCAAPIFIAGEEWVKEREKRLNPILRRRQGARVLKTFPLLQPLFQRFVRPDRQGSSESPPPSLLFMSENTHTHQLCLDCIPLCVSSFLLLNPVASTSALGDSWYVLFLLISMFP